MARLIKPGQIVGGYEILEELNKGGMAIAYAAKARADGRKVFFKQYKSPSVSVDWYPKYVAYQKQVAARLAAERAGTFCCHLLAQFEEKVGARTFFQAFEFVKGGLDMEQVLDGHHGDAHAVGWPQRLILAKVMMAGIAALHEAGIVHGDLKPANLQLLQDKSISSGYRLMLIDMDFSVLADQLPPWHGKAPYVGTDGYFSPEHLAGRTPVPASDVFTCGLILHELLGQRHPYQFESPVEYAAACRDHRAAVPTLRGPMPAPADAAAVAGIIHRCLHPDPAARPSARQVNLTLNGRADPIAAEPPPRIKEVPLPKPGPKSAAAPPPPKALHLRAAGGPALRVAIRTAVGRHNAAGLGADAKYLADVQFTLDRGPGGRWHVLPGPATPNLTLLNGEPLRDPSPLSDGDELAVGNASGTVRKLPMTVSLEAAG